MTPAFRVRAIEPADRAAVGAVAYATAFFGESAARFFPSRTLFELLWVAPYFQPAAGPLAPGFVALLGEQVVGYVIGSSDPRSYRRAVAGALWHERRAGLGDALGGIRASWPYLARAARYPPPHVDLRAYPAHLHINLLPQARGRGAGTQLLRTHVAELARQAVPGVHLSTTTRNVAALALYRNVGFELLASRVTPLWTPWLGHPAEHVVMGLSLPRGTR